MKKLMIVLALFFVLMVPSKAANVSGSPYSIDLSVTNVTSSAWVNVVSSLLKTSKGVMISNPSSVDLKLGVGAAGSEVARVYVPANSAPVFYPIVFSQASKISVIAANTTACSGQLSLTFLYN